MRKNLFLFLFPVLLAMVFPVMGFAQTRQLQQQVQPGPRLHLLLDAEWKFAFGNSADPAKDFNYSLETIFSKTGKGKGTAIDAAFDDSSWRRLQLPHDWAVELPFVESP